MEFARKQMEKHGWTDGSGLGKNEHGMKEAIKVTLKHDTRGVGHDAGEEFTFHWWDHVFNKAASTVQVDHTEDGVQVKNTGTTERHKTKKTKTYADKSMLYGQFVKGSTLTGGDEVEEPEKAVDVKVETIKAPVLMPDNEDEIFKKCGGRTAHKGARHGLKANGKLQRIQQQEEEELRRLMSASANQIEGNNSNLTNEKTGSSKKKKKRKHKDVDSNDCENDVGVNISSEESNESGEKKKRKKKKDNPLEDIEVACVAGNDCGDSNDVEDSVQCSGDRKEKKKKTKCDAEGQRVADNMSEDSSAVKKKKKKSRKRDREDENSVEGKSDGHLVENTKSSENLTICKDEEDVTVAKSKKKKKKKSKRQED